MSLSSSLGERSGQGRTGLVLVLGDQAVTSLGNFVGIAIIARIIGIEAFGAFVVVWLLANLAQMLVNAILIAPMINDRARLSRWRHAAHDRVLLEQAIALSVLFAVLFGLFASGLRLLSPSSALWGSDLWAMACIFSVSLAEYLRRRAFGVRRVSLALVQDGLRYAVLCTTGLLVLAGTFELPQRTETAFQLVTLASAVSIATGVILSGWGRPDAALRAVLFRRQSRFAATMAAERLLGFLAGNTQFFIIGVVLGPAALGGTRAAYNVARLSSVTIQAAENWLPARLAQQRSDRSRLWHSAWHMAGVFVAVQAVIFAGFLVLGSWLMSQFYGAEFGPYGYLVVYFAAYQVLVGTAVAFRSYFQVLGRGAIMLQARGWSTALGIGAAPGLVLGLGALGAPLTLYVSAGVFFAILAYGFLRHRPGD